MSLERIIERVRNAPVSKGGLRSPEEPHSVPSKKAKLVTSRKAAQVRKAK